MSLLMTDAIVLHSFDYLESSRILRLVTRDGGVRSVLARGARRSTRRFSSALDLYAQGTAELHQRVGRELDTLGSFDVARARPQLAGEIERFTGASTIAELTLRFARDAADPGLFDAVVDALDAIGAASAARARDATLAGAWRVLAELGIAPTVDECAECHTRVDVGAPAPFSHPAGGVLCPRCAHLGRAARILPATARGALRAWLADESHALASDADGRAHQRLLREFLHEHLVDGRPLRAFEVWEFGGWGGGGDDLSGHVPEDRA
jgi:DNA repair protein RecO (recombination protein O)